MRNKNTIELLGIWEKINNQNFNSPEFEGIKNNAGLNRFTISVKQWIKITNAIGLVAWTGRYNSGTFAHKDIAFEFGSWLSPEFKLYLIKEFQRLKEEENRNKSQNWSLVRTLTKINYKIHADAIKQKLIPRKITRAQELHIYASEADILNIATFGITAKDWENKNPDKEGNLRDYASIEQLIVLSNLESINSILIKSNINQSERISKLNEIAIDQMKSLLQLSNTKKLKP